MQGRRTSLSGVCYLTMGLLVLLLGLVFASMYVYRYFFITQVGVSWEGPLALQREQPDKLLQPLKELVLCTAVTREPVLWARQVRHVLSGRLRLTSIPTARPSRNPPPPLPCGFVLPFFFFNAIKVSCQFYFLYPTSLLSGVRQSESVACCEGRESPGEIREVQAREQLFAVGLSGPSTAKLWRCNKNRCRY